MRVCELSLNNFRNYHKQHITFGEGVNILYGDNAQGKTNVLEAIYLFATGKSHRTQKDVDFIRFGTPFADVKIAFDSQQRTQRGEMIFATDKRKRIKLNGIPIQKLGELMGVFNVVCFSPEDLYFIKEGPKERRRFIDICLSQTTPQYFYHLQQYVKVLEQRNAQLKRMNDRATAMLEVWNEKLVVHGTQLMRMREAFLTQITPQAVAIHREMTAENLTITYAPNISYAQLDDMQEAFANKLKQNMQREIEAKTTLYGPHRDDILFYINDHEVKTFGSQGQQRTVVLTLKLAEMSWMHEVKGEYPVLLLDDILS
ncbi:MAG: DNA replication/repair protein RecF [Hyphomonadaceae bacterium]|nr:DNA replication/repair protein RecF [Clostridia bacterium]